jgi:HlyD family secretion protein
LIFMGRNSGKSTTIVLILLGVGILVFVFAGLRGRDKALAISTTHASRRNLSSWIATNGKIEPIDPHIIQAQITTFIETIRVKEGQTIGRGQLLMTLDAQDLRSELAHMKEQLVAAEDEQRIALGGGSPDEIAQLNSDLARTKSEIDRLRREHDSLERLYTKQAATRQEIEQTTTALENAEADKRVIEEKKSLLSQRSKPMAERAGLRIEEARNAIRSLEEKLKSAEVAAPSAGTLYSLPAKAGTYVHTGDVLAELADLKRTRVRVFVDEPELGSLQQGQAVEITWEALPNRMWTGQVEQLPKTVVARGSRNVGEVLCAVNNGQGELLPNTNVNVRIRTGDRQNILTILRTAIRTEASEHYVFVVDQGRLRKRKIDAGISNATDYEILNGITEQDTVALPAGSEFREGMAVMITGK